MFMPGAMSQTPDYEAGRIFYVYLPGRGGLSGYVKPWVGHTYEVVSAIAGLLLALIIIWFIAYFALVPRDQWRLDNQAPDKGMQ